MIESGLFAVESDEFVAKSGAFVGVSCGFVAESCDIGPYRAESEKGRIMKRHPSHRADLPISLEIYHQLLSAASETGFEKEFWEIGESAIRDWMVRHHPDTFSLRAVSGYQWKELFLPSGTLLRTVFGARQHHCVVEDNEIIYQGASVSPSGFVNAVGGMRRNAWSSLWLLFPETKTWVKAEALKRPKGRSIPNNYSL